MPSEISFGGHDQRRLRSDLQWVPVHKPELGYWQLRLTGVVVAGERLPLCLEGDCATRRGGFLVFSLQKSIETDGNQWKSMEFTSFQASQGLGNGF